MENKDHDIIMGEIESKKGLIGNAIELAKKGGLRPGAGRPRGSKNKLTKEARIKEESVKERVLRNVDELVSAQLTLAKGTSHLFRIRMRNVGGKRKPEHIMIEDPAEIKRFLDGETEGEYYYITTKTPDGKAIDSLLDRAFGKATAGALEDNSFNFNIIQYGDKDRIGEVYHDTVPVRTEELSAGIPKSPTEIQDSSVASPIGENQDSLERADTQSIVQEG